MSARGRFEPNSIGKAGTYRAVQHSPQLGQLAKTLVGVEKVTSIGRMRFSRSML